MRAFLENTRGIWLLKPAGVYATLSADPRRCRFVSKCVVSISPTVTTQGSVVLLIYYHSVCIAGMKADGNGSSLAGASVSLDFLRGLHAWWRAKLLGENEVYKEPISTVSVIIMCNQLFNDTLKQEIAPPRRRQFEI